MLVSIAWKTASWPGMSLLKKSRQRRHPNRPRPERPPFVRQFRERIPRYMRRHRVKSGMTGWAQVNGWRGNTSIEKRIEFDLYYIENWSLLLDLKILILTLFRGFGQDHAY